MDVIEAPQWFKDQMEALRKLPPPTIEQVKAQFETCARLRKEMDLVELKKLCQEVVNDKLTLDQFLDECQMLFLGNGYDVQKRI